MRKPRSRIVRAGAVGLWLLEECYQEREPDVQGCVLEVGVILALAIFDYTEYVGVSTQTPSYPLSPLAFFVVLLSGHFDRPGLAFDRNPESVPPVFVEMNLPREPVSPIHHRGLLREEFNP